MVIFTFPVPLLNSWVMLNNNVKEQRWGSFILTYSHCQSCTAAIRLITFTNTVALHLCPDFVREGLRKRD